MKRVLSVSYDFALLQSRQYLLESLGTDVTSAYGFTDALKVCSQGEFDLFVLGNSIPNPDKAALIKKFRESCPAPILEMYSQHETPTGLAEHNFEALQNPSCFVELVTKALGLNPQQRT